MRDDLATARESRRILRAPPSEATTAQTPECSDLPKHRDAPRPLSVGTGMEPRTY
jgi:hypothetical protein